MAAGTSASLCLTVCFLVCSSEAQTNIRADFGQEVILPCKVPDKYNIQNNNIAVEWNRPELDPEHIFYYRYGWSQPEYQEPSYQNRVDLQDKEMKDRDVSLILRNMKKEDTGTYMCRVFEEGKNELINIVNLEVLLSGNEGRSTGVGGKKTGVIVGSVVGVIFLLAVASVGFLTYKQHKRQIPNLPVPPDEATV